MSIRAVNLTDVPNAPALWQEIIDASASGWIWHTWLFHEFDLCAAEKYAAEDLSFFVYNNGKAVGVVPLVIQDKHIEHFSGREAAYYSGFLPWPCFRDDLEPEHRMAFETFAFTELERRAKRAGAGRISVLMTPIVSQGDERERVAHVAGEHHYLHLPSGVQMATVNPALLKAVKARYDYKHFSPLFTFTIAEGSEVADSLEETYFTLHVKDAGGQFRSRLSYSKQADFARKGEGFYVIARHKKNGNIAGIALISCYKGAAYYNSVAIDPSFQILCVGYQLQCRAIEELLHRGISIYALGPRWDLSTWSALVSNKQRSIAHFKDKFARHQSRDIYNIEKFLDAEFFVACMQERENAIRNYFDL